MNGRLLKFLVLGISLVLSACSPQGNPDGDAGDAAAKGTGAGRAKAVAAHAAAGEQAGVPQVVNPVEELREFDPRGILRWSAVADADVYEAWVFADAGLRVPVESSGGIRSREYQLRTLAADSPYYVVVYARVGGQWLQAPAVAIRTTARVLKPRLLNPQEELEGLLERGLLRWNAVGGADRYELWVYRDTELLSVAETSGAIRETQYQLTSLDAGRNYYAVLFARVGGTWHGGGALRIGVTDASARARILNTQEELDAFVVDGLLRWSAVTGAAAYEVWIFADQGLTTVVESSGSLATRTYGATRLQPGRTYFAQVYARVGSEWQVGSPIQLRTVATRTKARLTNPQEELESFAANGTLAWTPVPGAEFYEVWLYTDASLVSLAESARVNGTSYPLAKVCADATYYAQVHTRVDGSWTAGWPVRIDVRPGTSAPGCVAPAPSIELAADPAEVQDGASVTISWSAKFATGCAASGGWFGAKATSGRETLGPVTSNRAFALTCTGPSGEKRVETYVTVAGFTLAGMDDRYFELAVAQSGYLPRHGSILEFDDARGRFVEFDGVMGVASERPFAWTLVDGAIRVDLDTPVTWTSYVSGATYATAEEAAVLRANGITQVQIDYRTVGYTYARDVAANGSVQTSRATRTEVSAPPIRLGDGSLLTLQNLPVTEVRRYATDLRASRDIDWRPFVPTCPATGAAVCVPGVWGGPYRYSPGISAQTGQPWPETIYDDRLTFDAGGTVTGDLSGRSATWSVAADGALVIRYDDGWSATLRIMDALGPQYLVYAEFGNGQQRHAAIRSLFDGDGAFRLSEAFLVAGPQKYWNGEINAWSPENWFADGSRRPQNLFGWQLDAPGGAGRNFSSGRVYDCDDDGADDLQVDVRPLASWRLEANGGAVLDRVENRPGVEQRFWYPVGEGGSAEGRRFFALESERRGNGRVVFAPRINILQELDRRWNCVEGPGFVAAEVNGRFFDVAPAMPGYVALDARVTEFDPGSGTGRVYGYDEITGVGQSDAFSWTVQDGRIVAELAPPRVVSTFPSVSGSEFLTEEEQRILAEKYPAAQYRVDYSTVRDVYTRSWSADGIETVVRETTTDISAPPIQLDDGTVLTPSRLPIREVASTSTTLRADRNVAKPRFVAACPAAGTDVCVPGTWGGLFVYSPGVNDSTRQPYPVAPFADVFSFAADGTASGKLSARTASWGVDGLGALVLTYGDGWTQRVELLDPVGAQYGAGYEFQRGDERILLYAPMFKQGDGFVMSDAYLAGHPGRFWQADINGWNPANFDDAGNRRLDQYFGWQFDLPGPGGRNVAGVAIGDCDGDGPDDLTASLAALNWSLAAGVVTIDRTPARPGTRVRTWFPVAADAIGGDRVFHTVEFERAGNGNFRIQPRLTIQRELAEVWSCSN